MPGPDPGELAHCFIVRVTLEQDEGIEAHRRWLSRRAGVPVSLAAAARDLFDRALAFAPQTVSTRRRRALARARQLPLFRPATAPRTRDHKIETSET